MGEEGGLYFADTIDGEDSSFGEGGWEEGGGGMCFGMFYPAELSFEAHLLQAFGDGEQFITEELFSGCCAPVIWCGEVSQVCVMGDPSFGIKGEGDNIYIAEGEAGHVKAGIDREHRQFVRVVYAGGFSMFDAVQPFFFDGGYQLAIDQESGGRFVVSGVDAKDVK